MNHFVRRHERRGVVGCQDRAGTSAPRRRDQDGGVDDKRG
jgi:hypothetical protein